MEKIGRWVTPGFAGVVMVEAKKDVEARIGKLLRAPIIGEVAVAKGR
jgi:hypothetical protein